MKKHYLYIFLALTLTAFAVGDYTELESLINARAGYDFTKSANNIKFQVPKGTVGKIASTKLFKSGNYGIEIELQNGPKKGEKVFVYYTPTKPNMKFSKENPLARTGPSAPVEQASFAQTTKPTTAYRAPAEKPAAAPVAAVEAVARANELLQQAAPQPRAKPTANECFACKIAMTGADGNPPANGAFQEAGIHSPVDGISGLLDSSKDLRYFDRYGYSACVEKPSSMGGLEFSNKLETLKNNPVHCFRIMSNSQNPYRSWEFNFVNKATQDLHLYVYDDPKGADKDVKKSFIYLFPRKTVPRIQVQGDIMEVTLPTGELVRYNKNTKAVIDGAFSETQLLKAGEGPKKAGVQYTGSGLVVRLDGDGEKDLRQGAGEAVVSKGAKVCRIPKKELFPDQSDSSNFSFKYKDDASFNTYLTAKCGFGLD